MYLIRCKRYHMSRSNGRSTRQITRCKHLLVYLLVQASITGWIDKTRHVPWYGYSIDSNATAHRHPNSFGQVPVTITESTTPVLLHGVHPKLQ